MRKLLYISNFYDESGWSHAAQGYTLSLDAAGYDVCIRSIKLNNTNGKVPSRISELEKKNPKGAEIVIQHVLPHYMEYNGYFAQNIGLFVHETDSFGVSPWPNYLRMMDKLVVPNQQLGELARKYRPTFVVPHACDTSRYERKHTKLNIPELQNKFIFYFIGENIRRKNLAGLLKAFHLEFSLSEPVALLIKTSMPGLSPNDCGQRMSEFCGMIKQNLKLYKKPENYHREIIITDFLSEEDILNLHSTCQAFVNLSYGEAWSLVLMDALGMGKPVISNSMGGPKDMLYDNEKDEYYGILIENSKDCVFGCTETFGDLNSSRENWWNPSIAETRKWMRTLFENKQMYDVFSERGINRAYDFTFEKVGRMFEKVFIC